MYRSPQAERALTMALRSTAPCGTDKGSRAIPPRILRRCSFSPRSLLRSCRVAWLPPFAAMFPGGSAPWFAVGACRATRRHGCKKTQPCHPPPRIRRVGTRPPAPSPTFRVKIFAQDALDHYTHPTFAAGTTWRRPFQQPLRKTLPTFPCE